MVRKEKHVSRPLLLKIKIKYTYVMIQTMNFEKQQGKQEKEVLPTKDEVLKIIFEESEDLNFTVEKESSDEEGISFIQGMTTEPDAEGHLREYTYSRKSKTDDKLPPKIYVAFFSDGIPVGGDDIHSF